MKLLGLQLDGKLNFNLHIGNIFYSAANQLNALIRHESLMNFGKNNFMNYCPLVWMKKERKEH